MTQTTIRLDIVSDVMCPWCFIGKRRLEACQVLVPNIDIDIFWRPFLLDPTIPGEGMDRQTYLDRKFGPGQAREIYARIAAAGKDVGLDFNFEAIAKSPSTINAHRLIGWSKDAGCQNEVVERLFQLYFLEGKDIGDIELLVSVAVECGMSAHQVSERLKGDKDASSVRRQIALAQAMGVTGVPAFIFDSTYLVSGAQSPEILADVAHKAASANKGEAPKDIFAAEA